MVILASVSVIAAALFSILLRAECCSFSYSQQPAQDLPCNPERGGMVLVCQAHSNQGQDFDLLWLAIDQDKPELPRELTLPMYVIQEKKIVEKGSTTNIESMLHLLTVESLSKVYCQVRLKNHNLLPPSQAMNLSSIPPSPACNVSSPSVSSPLVNRTSTCIVHASLPQGLSGTTTPTDPPQEDMSVVLYVVVGVIGLFMVIIVALTVVVALLYQKKCREKAGEGHSGGEGAGETSVQGQAGFTNRLSTEKKNLTVTFSDTIKNKDLPPLPSFISSHTHKTCPTMPCPPTPTESAKMEESRSESQLMSIYRTLREGETEKGEEVDAEEQEEQRIAVVPSSPSNVNWASDIQAGMANPGYTYVSPHEQEEADYQRQIMDSAFIRTQYEWSEPNTLTVTEDKYRGNYERDPRYMAHIKLAATVSLPERTLSNGHPVSRERAASEHARKRRADKYRGDYERCKTYEFPSLSASAKPIFTTFTTSVNTLPMSCDQPPTSCDIVNIDSAFESEVRDTVRGGKYSGDYERSPIYIQHLLKTQSVSPATSSHREYVQDIATR